MMLFSMYFDDATMQDWQSEAFHSQACVAELMQLLGSPWAKAKSQVCSSEGDFLGLMHDVSRAEENCPLLAQGFAGSQSSQHHLHGQRSWITRRYGL